MPDASPTVHPPAVPLRRPRLPAAAEAVKDRSNGHCQLCAGSSLSNAPLAPPYPPADQTTIADLTGCRNCHVKQHLAWLFENAGGSPEVLCTARRKRGDPPAPGPAGIPQARCA